MIHHVDNKLFCVRRMKKTNSFVRKESIIAQEMKSSVTDVYVYAETYLIYICIYTRSTRFISY